MEAESAYWFHPDTKHGGDACKVLSQTQYDYLRYYLREAYTYLLKCPLIAHSGRSPNSVRFGPKADVVNELLC